MHKIEIKPLSVNEAFTGRRFKTPKYRQFVHHAMLMMPKRSEIQLWPKMKLDIIFRFSSKGSDLDNGIKQFLDCLSKKYCFNDNQIYEISARKQIVHKGQEVIFFEIKEFEDE